MNADGSGQHRISDGTGKTTCGYFFAYNTKVFYASTRAADSACPKRPDPSKGYVWGLDKYDIYTANADGSGTQRLTHNNVYTAEGTLSPDGKTIVFTSLKDGDLDIYTMNVDGSDVRRLTNTPGYDGGPFFSPDGKRIVYRAYHPSDSTELAEYREPAQPVDRATEQDGDLGDERRRQRSASDHAPRRRQLRARSSRRTASGSSFRRTTRIRTAASSISTWSTIRAARSSR